MAQSVKNNARKRKPPSHLLNELYSPQHLESSLNPNLLIKETPKSSSDPYSIGFYARVLTKFVDKTNLSLREFKSATHHLEKIPQVQSSSLQAQQPQLKANNLAKEAKQTNNRTTIERKNQKMSITAPQREKVETKSTIQIPPPPTSKSNYRQTRSQQPQNTNPFSGLSGTSNLQALSRVSQEQLRKFMSQGIDPSVFQSGMSLSQINSVRSREPINAEQQREMKEQYTKLFKRASYHVGLAYYIHVQKLKSKGSLNFQDLDPTLISRKMRQDNEMRNKKQQIQEAQRLQREQQQRQQEFLMQRQFANLQAHYIKEMGEGKKPKAEKSTKNHQMNKQKENKKMAIKEKEESDDFSIKSPQFQQPEFSQHGDFERMQEEGTDPNKEKEESQMKEE